MQTKSCLQPFEYNARTWQTDHRTVTSIAIGKNRLPVMSSSNNLHIKLPTGVSIVHRLAVWDPAPIIRDLGPRSSSDDARASSDHLRSCPEDLRSSSDVRARSVDLRSCSQSLKAEQGSVITIQIGSQRNIICTATSYFIRFSHRLTLCTPKIHLLTQTRLWTDKQFH